MELFYLVLLTVWHHRARSAVASGYWDHCRVAVGVRGGGLHRFGELGWPVGNRTNYRLPFEWPESDGERSRAEHLLHLVRDEGFASPAESGYQLRYVVRPNAHAGHIDVAPPRHLVSVLVLGTRPNASRRATGRGRLVRGLQSWTDGAGEDRRRRRCLMPVSDSCQITPTQRDQRRHVHR